MTNFDWIAIYGAVLSTLVAFREYWTSRNKFKVTMNVGMDRDRHDGLCAVIRVMNHGNHPLMLFHVGLVWPYRQVTLIDRLSHFIRFRRLPLRIGWVHGPLPDSDEGYAFPCRIEPKESEDFWLPYEAINEGSDDYRNILMAFAQDALGRDSYSAPFTMRPKKVLDKA